MLPARREELIEISNNPRYDNPKLKKLNEVILNKYKNNPDMRAIIFCKTREMTMALKNSIEESSELAGLSPYHLVGANASAERGGM
jgi:ATP-dependent RNA helicase DDX58